MPNNKPQDSLKNHDLGTDSQIKIPTDTLPKASKVVESSIEQASNLPADFFHITVNNQAMFDTVMSERASQRQGTHKVKDRSEVRGGGRKPWRQKGTGRARAGSIRSPIWVGGGTVFGPKPERNYSLKVNKKIRNLALKSALSLQASHGIIFSHEFNLEVPSTKTLLTQIKALNLPSTRKVLIVSENPIVYKSAQNTKNIWVNKWASLHVEEILNAEVIIFAPQILAKLSKQEGVTK